jgi:hypothetical protein
MVLGEGHPRGAPSLDLYDGLSLRWGTPETSLSCGRCASRRDNAGRPWRCGIHEPGLSTGHSLRL